MSSNTSYLASRALLNVARTGIDNFTTIRNKLTQLPSGPMGAGTTLLVT